MRTPMMATLLVTPFLLTPVDLLAEESKGGDGDDGVVDVPPPLPSDPIVLALDQAPICGVEGSELPDWKQVFNGIPAELLVLAIEDGTVGRPHLSHAIEALAAIGSVAELEYVLSGSEDISWAYLADAAYEGDSDEEVLRVQAQLAAKIRAEMLWSWAKRGDLPDDLLIKALWDAQPLVSRRAVALALSSSDESVRNEALDVCGVNDAVKAEAHLCPGS